MEVERPALAPPAASVFALRRLQRPVGEAAQGDGDRRVEGEEEVPHSKRVRLNNAPTEPALREGGSREGYSRGRGGRSRGPGGAGGVKLAWQQRSYVPDHVRHPEKWTVYELGEELVVGGGEQCGSSAAGALGQGTRLSDGSYIVAVCWDVIISLAAIKTKCA